MSTIGYGDVCPITVPEKGYTIVVVLITSGLFSYLVSSIGQILLEIQQKNKSFKKQMSIIINHLQVRNVSKVTLVKIKKYFSYIRD